MTYFMELFGKMSIADVVVFLAAIGFLVVIFIKAYKFITQIHDYIQERRESLDIVNNTINEIKENLKGFEERLDIIDVSLNEVIIRQNDLAGQYIDFETETRNHNLNKLRDRLLQIYRYYTSNEKNPLKAWTEMEKDAFDKLFKDYEKLGGDGFMHSTVEPAMASLTIISMTDTEEVSALMSSRKG